MELFLANPVIPENDFFKPVQMKAQILILLLSVFLTGSPLQPPCKKNENAAVIPCPDQRVNFANNIVYAPTFRASWTMLKEDVIGEDVKLVEPVPVTACLNRSPFRPASSPEWVVCSGYIDDGVIDQIQLALTSKFSITEPDLNKYKKEKGGIVCYSCFRSNATFRLPFESLTWKFKTGEKEVLVECFGLSKSKERPDPIKETRKQAKLFDYQNPDDFIVRITGADMAKEIILAKVPFETNLGNTFASVMGRVDNSFPDDISNIDELIIPKINLSVIHDYKELDGKFLANKGFTDYFFASARQKINFRMDESGVSAEANGRIVLKKGPKSRILAYDKPFLVILRSVGSVEPDLVIWIANTGFMVPVH